MSKLNLSVLDNLFCLSLKFVACLRSIYIHLCLSYDFAGDHELQPISLPSNNLNVCSGKCKLVHRAKIDKQQDM